MFRHHFIRETGQLFQRFPEFCLPAVAHRDGAVAQKSRILGALDRAGAENLTKFVFAQTAKIFERRREMARLKGGLAGYGRLTIPRTHVLTDVAAEDMPAYPSSHLFRNRTMQLDGEVRNAAPRIHLVAFLRDRLRRAGIDAASAGAATIGRRAIRVDLERRQDLA